MDRYRDRSGDGGGRHSRMPSRWSDGPPLGEQPPRHFNHSDGGRGGDGFSGGRHHPYRSGGGSQDYPPGGGGEGRSPSFRSGPAGYVGSGDEPLMQGGPRRGGGGGFGAYGRGGSPNDKEGSKFAKLFVGSIPRTATEEDIRPLFEEHGKVMEVALIRDKRTGQQQSCCFIKYATSEDADRAIQSLHNQVTLPGVMGPIQVRYADGERERIGAVEHKLFVGSLNKRATEKEVEEIFSVYGHVEDVYLMRDEMKLSRGCGFVKFSGRDMAQAAINALNGVFTMRGCEQPLIVRFADPKRPRPGESRGGPAFGGPGFGSRSQPPSGFRSTSQFDEPIGGRFPPNAWSSVNPESLAPSSQASPHVLSSSHLASMGGFPSTAATGFSSAPHAQPISQQISHMQMPPMSPQELPSSLHVPQNQLNSASHFPSHSFMATTQHPSQFQIPKDQQNVHMQHSQSSAQQLGQLPINHSAGFPNFPQTLPSHQLLGLGAQMLTSQPPMHPGAAATLQMPLNLQQGLPSGVDQQQLPVTIPQPHQQTVQQSPTQVLPQQQAQALQANFPSQQPFSQFQQMQLMQHSNLSQQSNSQLSSTALKQQQVSNSHAAGPAVLVASSVTPPSPSLQLSFQGSALTCSWTEHTSPEGFKYYYNSVTKESKWEKPEEFTIFEQQQKLQQQQQNFAVQQLQLQSQLQFNSQLQSTQPVSQLQQAPHIQLRHAAQLQQVQPSLAYHGSSAVNTQNIQDLISPQLQGPGSDVDNARLQKVPLASQDWMWKNKPTGT